MIFKIYYTIYDDKYMTGRFDDYFIVEGEDIDEIRKKAFAEEKRRGLTVEKNNLWSEKISD